MGAEALPATANPVAREAPLVLRLQASTLVDHVARIDWSLLDQLPGERSDSIPRRCPVFNLWGFVHHHRRFPRSAEELILTVATLFFLFTLSQAHTSSDLPANEISGCDPASARLPESRPKPRQPTSIVPNIELGDLGFGRGIHGDALKSGCSSNGFMGSSLMGLYSRCGFVKDATEVLDEITEKDIVVYTSIITGYGQIYKSQLHRLVQMELLDDANPQPPPRLQKIGLQHIQTLQA
ncbi:hypothetical protein FF1_023664 [Malus domestica]